MVDDGVRGRIEETESRFRTMADTAPVLLWMAGRDGLCDFFNQGWLDFTGRSMEEELGNGWAEGIHPEDFSHAMQIYMEAFVMRRAFAMEYRLRRRGGEYRWIFDQGAPRFDGGQFAGFIGSCVDVTSQHEAREALSRLNQVLSERVLERTALAEERETLLREVHHRTKNDLQLISSLLGMQGREMAEGPAAHAFEECQARVVAIAQIHEAMHLSADLGQLSFSEYLRTLSGFVERAAAPASGVALELDMTDDVALRAERAVPCAMIVHELVMNAFKHAFPEGRSGKVFVRCGRLAPGTVQISVQDDGVGMPESAHRGGLGWTLIRAFARQLGASVDVARQGGTRVELRFSDLPRVAAVSGVYARAQVAVTQGSGGARGAEERENRMEVR
jgi:PAS domain S-box-containing protein